MSKDRPGAQWVHAICSVVFDIDEGQKLEQCFPENALTAEEANDIAFHSFPVYVHDAPPQHLQRPRAPKRPFTYSLIHIFSSQNMLHLVGEHSESCVCNACRTPCQWSCRAGVLSGTGISQGLSSQCSLASCACLNKKGVRVQE